MHCHPERSEVSALSPSATAQELSRPQAPRRGGTKIAQAKSEQRGDLPRSGQAQAATLPARAP